MADPTIRAHLAAWLKAEEGTVGARDAFALPASGARFRSLPRPPGRRRGWMRSARRLFLAYRADLQKAGHSAQGINQTFKVLRRPFKAAADERLIAAPTARRDQTITRNRRREGLLYAAANRAIARRRARR